MPRGEYSPANRENRFHVEWAEKAAGFYARERAYDAITRPLLPLVPTIDRAMRVNKAVRWMRKSAELTGGRAEAEKPLAQVGGELFHSVADRKRAIAQLSTEFQALVNDISVWHMTHQTAPNVAATVQWIAADVTPVLEEWHNFVACENKSWWTKAATKWDTFDDWQERLRRLRGLARAHGITLESQEPRDLPRTIWERGEDGKGSEAAALLGVLKIGVAAALGITGFVTMFAVVRELKAPKVAVIATPHPAAR